MGNGREWGEVGAAGLSGGLSFSITKFVATKHPVDVTSPHSAHGCRPMLQLHYRCRLDRRTTRCGLGIVYVGPKGRADARAGGQAHLPLIPTRLSPTMPPPHGSDSRGPIGGRSMDGRTGRRPSMRQHLLIAGVRLRTKTTLLQYYEQFHAVTK